MHYSALRYNINPPATVVDLIGYGRLRMNCPVLSKCLPSRRTFRQSNPFCTGLRNWQQTTSKIHNVRHAAILIAVRYCNKNWHLLPDSKKKRTKLINKGYPHAQDNTHRWIGIRPLQVVREWERGRALWVSRRSPPIERSTTTHTHGWSPRLNSLD